MHLFPCADIHSCSLEEKGQQQCFRYQSPFLRNNSIQHFSCFSLFVFNYYLNNLFCTSEPQFDVNFLMYRGNFFFFKMGHTGSRAPGELRKLSPPSSPLQLQPSSTARRCCPAVPPSSALSLSFSLSLSASPACLSPASPPQPTRAAPSGSLRDQSAPPPGPFSHIPLLGRGYISSQALPALALLCVCAPQPRQQRQAEEEEGDW